MFYFLCDYGIVRLPEIVFAGPADPCPEEHGHRSEYCIELTMLIGHERCYEKLVFPTKQLRDGTFEDLLSAMRQCLRQESPVDTAEEEEVPDGDDT